MGVIFFALNAGISTPKARYVFVLFGASGIWTSLPVILAWLSNTISYPAEVKAISQATVNGVGNLASIYGAYIWPSSSAPQYTPGNAGMLASFTNLGLIGKL